MKHLPKSTPTEILNDPYGFTYKEMSEVIGHFIQYFSSIIFLLLRKKMQVNSQHEH